MNTQRGGWWARLLSLLVAAMGVANMLSSLVVRVGARESIIRDVLPLEVIHGTRYLALVAGLALLAISRGLWRGKRWTWGVALAVLGSSAVFHLLKGLDWEEASAALLIAALLVWQRDAFRARADRPTLRRAFIAIGLGCLVFVVYLVVGFAVLRNQFAGPPTIGAIWNEITARMWLDVGPVVATSRRARWFLQSISVVTVALVTYFIGAILRPIVARPAAATERAHAADLVGRYGTSSLAPFALTSDKSLFFGRHVDGMIAYVVANTVAVACGDPVVADPDLPALLHEWHTYCVEQGWDVCFYEAREAQLAVYEGFGLRTLQIGEDAWIDVQRFTLKGKPIADIRHAVSKVERDGITFHVLDPHAPGGRWAQMHSIAAAHSRGDWELQFSIGRLPTTPDPAARYTLALGADNCTVVGCCAWLPLPAVHGWALDVMQRHDDAPNGTMEYLIAQSLLQFGRDGAAWASLGVAPLADAAVDNTDERSLLQQGVRFLYEHPKINEMYRYKSLFFFKRKFVPQWRSVYLVYNSRLALPRVLYAVLKVHLPVIGPNFITEFLVGRGVRQVGRWRIWLRRDTAVTHAAAEHQRRNTNVA